MKYEKKLPTMAEITNWYLYKQENAPTEEERLDFSQIVSPDSKRIYVDPKSFKF
jgi:hypothetical protein